jgi:hypothetical protein
VRFCFSIPYLEANLHEFLEKYADSPYLALSELCRTRKGRSVERIHAGKINADPKYRVLLTARHHACETIASYTLEGLLEAVLADTDLGRWYQDNVITRATASILRSGRYAGLFGNGRKENYGRPLICIALTLAASTTKSFTL